MSALAFLTPAGPGGPVASSPLEPWLAAGGARLSERDGWRVAVDYGDAEAEVAACRTAAGLADRSSLSVLEVQGRPAALAAALESLLAAGAPAVGQAVRLIAAAPPDDGATPHDALLWRASSDRALAVCEPRATAAVRATLAGACGENALVDVTAGHAVFELFGPLARTVLERLTTTDVRAARLVPGGVRAGTIAHVAGTLLCVGADTFLLVVGAPEAPDAWEIVLDAGEPLGLRPVGEEARARA